MHDDDSLFLSYARDMLDIEMSSAFKQAKAILNETAEKLNGLGICYVLKFCENEHNDYDDSVSMHIACKCSEMTVANAGALLEYEQQRFAEAIEGARDEDI
jgi:hypothetical protein